MSVIVARRKFLAAAAGAAAWPMAAHAQQDARTRRIGLLFNTLENDRAQQANLGALREALAKLGWVEGRNLQVELRWGAGDLDLLATRATELVALAPSVIIADAGPATRAARHATTTIPIVYAAGGDPVVTGLVHDITRPEGNTTGFSSVEVSFAGKWLELLKQAATHLTRLAVLFYPDLLAMAMRSAYIASIKSAADTLGVQTMAVSIRNPIEIVRALDSFAAEPNGGMIVLPGTTNGGNRDTIIQMAVQQRLPSIYSSRTLTAAGGLMSYGPDVTDQYRRAALYVDRLLRGTKVSDLPVQFPTKYQLVVNMRTAKQIGLAIPEAFLLHADELIE